MSHRPPIDVDSKSPPFDQFGSIHWLAAGRSGHASVEHARHQLYVARDKRSRANVLIKVTSKPGLVYEQDLTNEIASLSTINRELPDSKYFPVLGGHGRLRDDRVYLTMSRFDEWPLATTIGSERCPQASRPSQNDDRGCQGVGRAYGLKIWHVDLNPMNILCRWKAVSVIRMSTSKVVRVRPALERGFIIRDHFRYSAPSCPAKRPMRDRICLFGRGALHDARWL